MDEYLPSSNQLFQDNIIACFVGSTNSGKSYQLQQMLTDMKYQLIGQNPTSEIDQSQQILLDFLEKQSNLNKLSDSINIFNKEEQLINSKGDYLRKMEQICKQQIEMKKQKKQERLCFICDDLIGEVNYGKNGMLENLVCKIRHYDVDIWFLIQYLKALSPQFRNQINIWCVWQNSDITEIKKLQQTLGGTKQQECLEIMKDCWSKRYGFICIFKNYPEQLRFFRGYNNQFQQYNLQ